MSLGDTIQLVTLVTVVIALGLTIWQARQMMKQTALMFTEGRGFVTLQFVGGSDSPPPPPDFVTDVGKKQDAAVKNGLGG